MSAYKLVWSNNLASAIVNLPNGPYAEGSSPVITGQLKDVNGIVVPGSRFTSVTLTIIDTASGAVINGVQNVDILNTGRGVIDNQGNLTITLLSSDTSMSEAPGVPSVQRSLIVKFASGPFTGVGRGDFQIVAIGGS
jgi:hypothetical protein